MEGWSSAFRATFMPIRSQEELMRRLEHTLVQPDATRQGPEKAGSPRYLSRHSREHSYTFAFAWVAHPRSLPKAFRLWPVRVPTARIQLFGSVLSGQRKPVNLAR